MAAKKTHDQGSLKRLGGGRWQTRDERFTIEPQSGTWVIVDGEQTDDLGLPSVPIGDSTTIGQEDHITVFGFPGIADSSSPQKTEGSVSGFIPDERLSTNRAFINSDVAIAPGNSGGQASGRAAG